MWTIPFHAYNGSKLDDFSHLETPEKKRRVRNTKSNDVPKQGSK